jgi:L-ascorbate metabolism protein UlaG (beta-lactamase superfamily)
MTTSLTWLGHGAFSVETSGKTILIDPFLTGNPLASTAADQVKADYIIVSHGHGDHVGDTVAIAKRTNALVIANYEIATWFSNQGVERTHGMNTGGSFKLDCGTVKLTLAHHGSMLPDGSYGGCANGVLLKLADGTIYHACDTALFSDMTLIGDEGLDVAIVPIGDNYTMGPDDAIRAVEFLCPKVVIPGHYNTFPVIAQDADQWAAGVVAKTKARPVVLKPGGSFQMN